MRDNQARARFVPLDLLRGAAVFGMLLVTSPGAWDASYAPLMHAEWRGWTLADMVFPTFLFCVGAAIVIAFPRSWSPEAQRAAWRRIARRTLLLILLGLALNALPYFDLAHMRLPGVLQRIALCYAAVATLVLLTLRRNGTGRVDVNPQALAIVAAALLIVYWALLAFVPAPGIPAGQLTPEGSLPAWIDQQVFTIPHLWEWGKDAAGNVTYDPEGLLSTLGAIVNVIAGALSMIALRRSDGKWWVLGAGVVLIVSGLVLDPAVPMIKRLWTDSFALFSSGFSMVLLTAFVAIGDTRASRTLGYPLRVLGANAVLAFVIQQVWAAYWGRPYFGTQAEPKSVQELMYGTAHGAIADPQLASLIVAILVVALITLLVLPFHRRGMHFRL